MRRIISFIIALTMTAAFVPTTSAQVATLSDGLIAYYDFSQDGSAPETIADASGNGNNAVVLNSSTRPLVVQDGIAVFPGHGGYYDYGSALLLPNSFNQGITDYTVSMWVKADSSYAYADKMQRFWDFGNRDGTVNSGAERNSIFVRYTAASGQFRLQDRGTGGGSDTSSVDMTYTEKPFTDRWGLLTVTFEKTGENAYYTPHVYINGVEDESFSASQSYIRSLDDLGELSDTSNGLFIGRTQWYESNVMLDNPDFCGYMDDVRIYNRAITAQEVMSLYETTNPTLSIVKAISSVESVSVSTVEGTAPTLPATVRVTFNTDETENLAVVWDAIDASSYAQAGTFTVSGVITEYSYNITASVRVRAGGTLTIDDGMVLHYTFDSDEEEPSKITDSSGNQNDGVVLNTTETVGGWGPWGQATTYNNNLTIEGGAAKFTGSLQVTEFRTTRYVSGCAIELPSNINQNVADFTMSMWVKADSSYVYADKLQRFFDLGPAEGDTYNSIFFRYTASSGAMRLQDRVSSDSGRYIETTDSSMPFTDQWGHLTVTFEKIGSNSYYTPTIYINGVKSTAFAESTKFVRSLEDFGILSDSTSFLIGRTQWMQEADPDFCGYMDDIRLYDRALSESDVAELYTVTHPEQPVTITISQELEDGTKIAQDRTAEGRENTVYTYNPQDDSQFSQTLIYQMEQYDFAEQKSTLSINVGAENNVIRLVYVKKEVESVENADVSTIIKHAPVMTDKLDVTYTTGEVVTYDVTWDAIEESLYAQKGTFTANGVIDEISYRVSALVTVYGVDSVAGYKETDITFLDVYPDLPEAVTLTFENEYSEIVAVEWDAVPESNYKTDKTVFSVSGIIPAYDMQIQTQFTTVAIESVADVAISTPIGASPVFPDTVDALGSDLVTYQIPVTWEAYDEALLDDEGAFDVNGTISYKNMPAKAVVTVYISARFSMDATADTYTQASNNTNYGTASTLIISGTEQPAAAARIRYGYFKFDTSKISGLTNVSDAKLRLYVERIDNSQANPVVSVYSVPDTWSESELTWNTQDTYLENGTLISETEVAQSTVNSYVELDVSALFESAFVGDTVSLRVVFNTCAGYIASRESSNAPTLNVECTGIKVNVNAYTAQNELMFSTYGTAVAGMPYEYTELEEIRVFNSDFYVLDTQASTLAFDAVAADDTVTLYYNKATEIVTPDTSVVTYIQKAPDLPSVVTITVDNISYTSSVAWESIEESTYAQKGEFTVNGKLTDNYSITAAVKVFEPLYDGGQIVGAKGDLTIYYSVGGAEPFHEESVNMLYGSEFVLDASYVNMFDYLELESISGDITEVGQSIMLTQIGQSVYINYTRISDIRASFEAYILNNDNDYANLEISAAATVVNGTDTDVHAALIIAKYDETGSLEGLVMDKNLLSADALEGARLSASVDFDMSGSKTARAMLIDISNMRPLAVAIDSENMEIKNVGYLELTPTYSEVVADIELAQTFWQNNRSATSDNSFWHPAAYHTGNMEAYYLLENEAYKQYSTDWAEHNSWTGVFNSNDPSTWTYDYSENQYGSGVLFGDWQTCFQTYLDLNALDPDDTKTARVEEVMSYQVSTSLDNYWWWADALYMVMPVMVKMYAATGDETYLNKLYTYFKYAKEYMYDGPGGIPTDLSGYTTTARLKNGAAYADSEDYKYLFYRDSNYVYPLNPVNGQKNFWARGNGWVFAALAKVLADMPTDFDKRDEFLTTYTEMARAIRDSQKVDDDGNGFWTQSMLVHDYSTSTANPQGYETSGTAFFVYGMLWGINNGYLSENEYLECALRGWSYLSNISLLEDGKVGYVQQIGSAAGSAASQSTTQNFGVGAFLLAGCEMARYVDAQPESSAYINRKMQQSVAFIQGEGSYYANGAVTSGVSTVVLDNVLYLPVNSIAMMFSYNVSESEGTVTVSDVNGNEMVLAQDSSDILEQDSVLYVKAETFLNAFSKYMETTGGVTVISGKKAFFVPAEVKIVSQLKQMLTESTN
ncbi:MAG: glycoside hydrolase family 88 protein [Clostridia bacterium]|nr:glycoside hydrolase family 88 protein [Clostridia bacterium]